MKAFLLLFVALSLVAAENPAIGMQNTIMAQVNGKTISMMDVKKKMDMAFYQNYPQLANAKQALFQFYEANWQSVLMDMIDHELIIAEAENKEIKLTDGEVREVMEERFGPNIMKTLDQIGLTYDETWKMVRNEMIVQRMTGFFVYNKALVSVTPQDIRQEYRLYLEKNPPFIEWKYRIVSIRTEEQSDSLPQQVYEALVQSQGEPQNAGENLKIFEKPGVTINVSSEYSAKTHELSEAHKAALASLELDSYSEPVCQFSRTEKKSIYRIFYLVGKESHEATPFEELAQKIQNELVQKAVAENSKIYVAKLRKHYGFDDNTVVGDLQPFFIQ